MHPYLEGCIILSLDSCVGMFKEYLYVYNNIYNYTTTNIVNNRNNINNDIDNTYYIEKFRIKDHYYIDQII